MELTQEMVESLIRSKELEKLLYKRLGIDAGQAKMLASRLISYREDLLDILTAEYKVEVTRL